MDCRAVLVHLRADWVEICERFGFPAHGSATRPCWCCNSTGEDLFSPVPISLADQPWETYDDIDYSVATDECEIHVRVDRDHHAAMVNLMKYDKRTYGQHGLCLVQDFAPLGLKARDRLEPSLFVRDVGSFFTCDTFPLECTFWRSSRSSLVTHRCPLWDESLGITPSRTIAIDLLHTFYLGAVLQVAKEGLWVLIDSGVWGHGVLECG